MNTLNYRLACLLLPLSALIAPSVVASDFEWISSICGTPAASTRADGSGNLYALLTFKETFDVDPGPDVLELVPDGSSDIAVFKLDGDGRLVWARTFSGATFEELHFMAVESDGDVYGLGRFGGTLDFDPGSGVFELTAETPGFGSNQHFLVKLDGNGTFVWANALED